MLALLTLVAVFGGIWTVVFWVTYLNISHATSNLATIAKYLKEIAEKK